MANLVHVTLCRFGRDGDVTTGALGCEAMPSFEVAAIDCLDE
jgi:hypothetical protein